MPTEYDHRIKSQVVAMGNQSLSRDRINWRLGSIQRLSACVDYSPKPKVGFRALSLNEAWHVDASIVKLPDGMKANIHVVKELGALTHELAQLRNSENPELAVQLRLELWKG
jgi:hypothetical protein